MEEDNFKPDCDNIKKNIKSFTEDMLKDEDYKAFLHHLETCSECKNYVRSVDSFSNQLWRLGEIKVPSDFESTVLFKLTQPEEKPDEEEGSATSKKWIIGAVAFIVIGIIISAGLIAYLKLRQPSQEEINVAQVLETPGEVAGESLGDLDNDVVFEQYDDRDEVFEGTGELRAFEWTGDTVEDDTVDAEVSLGPKLVHWHFWHYNKSKELESLRLRRKKRSRESDLRKTKKEQLGAAGSTEQSEGVIQDLEEKIRQLEVRLEKNLAEKRRREGGPISILQSLDIKPDYQDNDFVFFASAGAELENVLNKIMLISEDGSSLENFTPGVSHLPHKKYQVSIFMVNKATAVFHWHVHLSMISQKLQLLKAIQENGGVITYEFAEEVTISGPSSKIGAMKAQMPAMRISLSEYGNQITQEEGSTVISIYFSK